MAEKTFTWLLCLLLIAAGFIFGHGFASVNNSPINFITSNVSGWIQFLIGMGVSYIYNKQSTKQSNRILRQAQLHHEGENIDLITGEAGEDHKLLLKRNTSEALSIFIPKITELKLEKVKMPKEN